MSTYNQLPLDNIFAADEMIVIEVDDTKQPLYVAYSNNQHSTDQSTEYTGSTDILSQFVETFKNIKSFNNQRNTRDGFFNNRTRMQTKRQR